MRKISTQGVNLIKSFETCRLTCFDTDGSGTPTIGWGRTRGLTRSDVNVKTISQEVADAYLESDLERFEEEMTRQIGQDVIDVMTDNQYGALGAFYYNEGSAGLSLLKVLKAKRFDLVPPELARYVYAKQPNGEMKKLAGLVRRRAAEQVLWQTDEPGSINADPPSAVTREADTPPAPSAAPSAKPLQKQGSFIAAAGTALATGAATVQPLVTSISAHLTQVSDTIQPYAESNSHVEQIRTAIIGIIAALSVLTVVLMWMRHESTKAEGIPPSSAK